jgi:hypothetical protein
MLNCKNAVKQGDRFIDALATEFVSHAFPLMLTDQTCFSTVQPLVQTLVPRAVPQWFHLAVDGCSSQLLRPWGITPLFLTIPKYAWAETPLLRVWHPLDDE